MQVFLSWSGSKSKDAADALKVWLPNVFADLKVWMSERDLGAGAAWGVALHEQLKQADFGILCLSRDNLTTPWIIYEAGALAMSAKAGCVVPYLLSVEPRELPPPLSLFQSVRADRGGTWKLVWTINQVRTDKLSDQRLCDAFERAWPSLAGPLGETLLIQMHGDVAVVTPSSSQLYEDDEIKALREKLKDILRNDQRRIVVDLVKVERIYSAGLTVFLVGRQQGGEVVLANMTPQIQGVLRSSGLSDMVEVFPTLNEALAHFTAQGFAREVM